MPFAFLVAVALVAFPLLTPSEAILLQVPANERVEPPRPAQSAEQEEQAQERLPIAAGQSSEKKDQPEPKAQSDDAATKTAPDQEPSELPIWFRYFATTVELFLAGMIAAYAIAQTKISKRQWWSMAKQNAIIKQQNEHIADQVKLAQGQLDHANETLKLMRLAQRAWLFVEEVKLVRLEIGIRLDVQVPIKNFGHSPAEIVAGLMKTYVRPSDQNVYSLIKEFEGLKNELYPSYMVVPQGPITLLLSHDEPMTEERVNDIRFGRYDIFAIGRMRYFDAMKQSYWCRFLYRYSFLSSDFYVVPGYGDLDH